MQFQKMFAGMAKARVERCSSGHSPMLSQTEMLVERIETAVEGAVNGAREREREEERGFAIAEAA